MSIEDPGADRLDQLRPVTPDEAEDADYFARVELPLDANPADVADQHRSVALDEEREG